MMLIYRWLSPMWREFQVGWMKLKPGLENEVSHPLTFDFTQAVPPASLWCRREKAPKWSWGSRIADLSWTVWSEPSQSLQEVSHWFPLSCGLHLGISWFEQILTWPFEESIWVWVFLRANLQYQPCCHNFQCFHCYACSNIYPSTSTAFMCRFSFYKHGNVT